jgi:hypothetical protein
MPAGVAVDPITLPELPDACFSADGTVVVDVAGLLAHCGLDEGVTHDLLRSIELRHGGVQDAGRGAIQDPAGSAIGSSRPSGAGASGAIYAAFTDLEPIPWIEPRSAIFNAARGPGRRVLHTHSPRLSGTPASAADRHRVLEDLANAYANALEAFDRHAATLGSDGSRLNLVPVAAAIFAGRFRHPALDHLHPSYTLTALLLAAAWFRATGCALPRLSMSFHASRVFDAACEVVGGIG